MNTFYYEKAQKNARHWNLKFAVEIKADNLTFALLFSTVDVNNNAIVDWGDGTQEYLPYSMEVYNKIAHVYSSPGIYNVGILISGLRYLALNENFLSASTQVVSIDAWSDVVFDSPCVFNRLENVVSFPRELPEGIKAIKPYMFYRDEAIDVILPDSITDIGMSAFVRSQGKFGRLPTYLEHIGVEAFSGCANLVLDSLPPGLTEIEEAVFFNCTSLSLTSLSNNIKRIGPRAFQGCTNLALNSLPANLEVIEDRAFRYCEKMNITKLPSKIKTIGTFAFQGCTNLELESLPSSLITVKNYAFNGAPLKISQIPGKVKSIGSRAFSGVQITEITFNGKPDYIAADAFQSCTNLGIIRVPWQEGEVANAPWGAANAIIIYAPFDNKVFYTADEEIIVSDADIIRHVFVNGWGMLEFNHSITEIKDWFNGTNVKTIELPEYTSIIDDYAFADCLELETIILSDVVEYIGQNAFQNCNNLKLDILPETINYIGEYAFQGCANITFASLPEAITEILPYTFDGCTELALVTLPSSLTSIGEYAFRGTKPDFTFLPDGVASIGEHAFDNCGTLMLAFLPTNLLNIADYAFANCTNLTTITFQTTPTSIANNIFTGCINLTAIRMPWIEGEVPGMPWGAPMSASRTYGYNLFPTTYRRCLAVLQPMQNRTYINIGLSTSVNDEWRTVAAVSTRGTETSRALMGGSVSKQNSNIAIWVYPPPPPKARTSQIEFIFGNGQDKNYTLTAAVDDTTKLHSYRVKFTTGEAWADNKYIGKAVKRSSSITQSALEFLGASRAGTHQTSFEGEVGETIIIRDGKLLRYLVPCERLADGRGGFYDLCGSSYGEGGTPFYTAVAPGQLEPIYE